MKKVKKKILINILAVFLSLPASVFGASLGVISEKPFTWSENSGAILQAKVDPDENENWLVIVQDQAGQQSRALFAPPPGGGTAVGEFAPVHGDEFLFFSCTTALYLAVFSFLRKKNPVINKSEL